MKKHCLSVLFGVTLIFVSFTLGFFVGRNQNRHSVQISQISTSAKHDLTPTAVTEDPEETTAVSFPIDINTADSLSLTALSGIGPTLAQRIIDYRNANGPFENPEELLNVEGIGPGTLEAILDYVTTGG